MRRRCVLECPRARLARLDSLEPLQKQTHKEPPLPRRARHEHARGPKVLRSDEMGQYPPPKRTLPTPPDSSGGPTSRPLRQHRFVTGASLAPASQPALVKAARHTPWARMTQGAASRAPQGAAAKGSSPQPHPSQDRSRSRGRRMRCPGAMPPPPLLITPLLRNNRAVGCCR